MIMNYWPSLYAFIRNRRESEDLILADMLFLLENGTFALEHVDAQLSLVRKSNESVGHPVFDMIGSSATAGDLADFAFSLREKFFLWVIKSSEPYVRWDIENVLNNLSLWMWVISLVGWVPFYFFHVRSVLWLWFFLPTVALIISVVKAPLTADGQSLLKDGNRNNAVSFKVARNGLNGLKGTNVDLIQFAKLFKTLYRGKSVRPEKKEKRPTI
ncbi:MAG TPA: hypothetical protein PKI14_02425 [Fervidobacterium sp.]|nr:hypothetical protein [Fervidobacterium sp.]